MTWFNSPAVLRVMGIAGRIGIAYLFCSAGYFHLTMGWQSTIADMTARHIPLPAMFNILAMVVSVGLALAVLFGVLLRWATLGLALYTFCVSWVMYTPVPGVSPQIYVLFLKDMAIFGGLLTTSCTLATNARLRRELSVRYPKPAQAKAAGEV